ncbi:MAG: hypothetical protein JWQ96_676 [Segetibacter sp.]|nr:hypothetical protein [Segetibacter sp.]
MKSLITAAVCCVVCTAASAQESKWSDSLKKKAFSQNPLVKSSPAQKFDKRLFQVTPPPIEQPEDDNAAGVKRLPLSGKYIGNNGMGADIYAMQPDNMPCLVPKAYKSNMPVAKYRRTPQQLNEGAPKENPKEPARVQIIPLENSGKGN